MYANNEKAIKGHASLNFHHWNTKDSEERKEYSEEKKAHVLEKNDIS